MATKLIYRFQKLLNGRGDNLPCRNDDKCPFLPGLQKLEQNQQKRINNLPFLVVLSAIGKFQNREKFCSLERFFLRKLLITEWEKGAEPINGEEKGRAGCYAAILLPCLPAALCPARRHGLYTPAGSPPLAVTRNCHHVIIIAGRGHFLPWWFRGREGGFYHHLRQRGDNRRIPCGTLVEKEKIWVDGNTIIFQICLSNKKRRQNIREKTWTALIMQENWPDIWNEKHNLTNFNNFHQTYKIRIFCKIRCRCEIITAELKIFWFLGELRKLSSFWRKWCMNETTISINM